MSKQKTNSDLLDLVVIDFAKKGNLLRLYLGDKKDNEYWGDDWDNYPYHLNAGKVYSQYIKNTIDIVFPFDFIVLEPKEQWHDYYDTNPLEYAKVDMKQKKVPCIVAKQLKDNNTSYTDCFEEVCKLPDSVKIYFGDSYEKLKKIKNIILLGIGG